MRVLAFAVVLGAASTAVAIAAAAPEPAVVLPVAASESTPWSDAWLLERAPRYLDDGAARRDALERSLAAPDNLYSRMRLSAYARGDAGWDLLPQWNPRALPLDDGLLAAYMRGDADARVDASDPLWDGARPTTMQGWVELGRRVFFAYPLRPEAFVEHALASPELAAKVGLQRTEDGEWPGAVLFRDVDGTARIGITCALCHSSVEDGELVVGRARREFDYGAMRLAWHAGTGDPIDPELAARLASWGPGRADITEDDDADPVAIPDLWRLRELRALTQAGTILQHESVGGPGPLALAIRQETQILHANRGRVRPPRELAWALAMFLYSLEPPPREVVATNAAAVRGRELFAKHCAGCHEDASGSGDPVDARRVGTDRALADGTSRGTGRYRPAPLVRVAEAAPYLHDGTVATLDDLLDPARLHDDFTHGVRGVGAVPGHAFGTRLPPHDRDALVAWLRTL